MTRELLILALLSLFECACTAEQRPPPTAVQPEKPTKGLRGEASYYADSLAGRSTASGEPYDPRARTCAHKTLPFGTVVDIRAVASGRRATCRVNDRGPFVRGRVLDVSRAVAEELGMVEAGVIDVVLELR